MDVAVHVDPRLQPAQLPLRRGAAEHGIQHRVLGRRERQHQIDSRQELQVSDGDVIPGIADWIVVQAGEIGSHFRKLDTGRPAACIEIQPHGFQFIARLPKT